MGRDGLALTGMPLYLVRAEAFFVFLVGLYFFWLSDWSWWWFAGLFLLPDLSMLGYLAGPRIGALTYNCAHTYVAPALLLLLAYYVKWGEAVPVIAIWVAHIGFDRVLGFGLKYASAFRDTHLGRLGGA